MPHYIFSLTPINSAVSTQLTQCAQKYFAPIYDEYILGKGALPHITLAHFEAENDEAAIKAYKEFAGKQQLMLSITDYKYDVAPNNSMWAAYYVEKSPELLALQSKVCDHLEKQEMKPKKDPKSYAPHITLARLKEKPTLIPALTDVPEPYKYKFRMSLGASTEIGAYTKTLMA